MYLWSFFWRVVFLGTSEHQIGYIKCIRQKVRVSKWKCMWEKNAFPLKIFSHNVSYLNRNNDSYLNGNNRHFWIGKIPVALELALHLVYFLNRTIILFKLKQSAGHCVINICLCSISHFLASRKDKMGCATVLYRPLCNICAAWAFFESYR